ncbi:hypothetical protein CC86DRAFT_366685 [Ophiobolus disseminans]|uniref:Uncharacterized protein n=1 Tax=Ophiobolus disseminans TaxID=1469910 RepID=A0A6A7AEY9_9PLEO|nr:hypothetical protein CC86DRAFT_366685 [Ophiobolus disseminans]
MPDIAANEKVQPWRAHWPPTTPVDSRFMAGLKKGDLLTIDGGSGSGRSEGVGYNDKGEGVVPLNKGREKK